MRKLMQTTALVMPLLAVPALAQESPGTAPADGTPQQTAPQGQAGAADEADVEVVQQEPDVEVVQQEPQVEIETEEPQVEVVQEPAQVDEPIADEQPATAEQPETADGTEAAEQPAAATPEAVVTEMGQDELRGDWVTGTTVTSPEGETIGQIQDLIITPEGEVTTGILSVGGFLGIGAKNIAVDWSEFEIEQDGQQITLDLTREEAENAPEYAFREQAQPAPAADPAAAPATDPTVPAGGTQPAPATDPAAPGTEPEGTMPQ